MSCLVERLPWVRERKAWMIFLANRISRKKRCNVTWSELGVARLSCYDTSKVGTLVLIRKQEFSKRVPLSGSHGIAKSQADFALNVFYKRDWWLPGSPLTSTVVRTPRVKIESK